MFLNTTARRRSLSWTQQETFPWSSVNCSHKILGRVSFWEQNMWGNTFLQAYWRAINESFLNAPHDVLQKNQKNKKSPFNEDSPGEGSLTGDEGFTARSKGKVASSSSSNHVVEHKQLISTFVSAPELSHFDSKRSMRTLAAYCQPLISSTILSFAGQPSPSEQQS